MAQVLQKKMKKKKTSASNLPLIRLERVAGGGDGVNGFVISRTLCIKKIGGKYRMGSAYASGCHNWILFLTVSGYLLKENEATRLSMCWSTKS